MTNLDSIFKSRDIILPTKVHLVKAMVFPAVVYGCESWTIKKLSSKELMLLNYGVGEDSWESFGLQGDQTSESSRKSVLNIHWKDWCWSWNSNTLDTWCKKLTHWKRPWCWERLRAGGEGDDRGQGDRRAPLTPWTSVWASSRRWWWTGSLAGVVPGIAKTRTRLRDWTRDAGILTRNISDLGPFYKTRFSSSTS